MSKALDKARDTLKIFQRSGGIITRQVIECAVEMELKANRQAIGLLVEVLAKEFNI